MTLPSALTDPSFSCSTLGTSGSRCGGSQAHPPGLHGSMKETPCLVHACCNKRDACVLRLVSHWAVDATLNTVVDSHTCGATVCARWVGLCVAAMYSCLQVQSV